jgi:hypothetical protein
MRSAQSGCSFSSTLGFLFPFEAGFLGTLRFDVNLLCQFRELLVSVLFFLKGLL